MTGANIAPANTRKTTPASSAYKPASHFPAVVCNGSTGPIPPNNIAAFRNASGQPSPSTPSRPSRRNAPTSPPAEDGGAAIDWLIKGSSARNQ